MNRAPIRRCAVLCHVWPKQQKGSHVQKHSRHSPQQSRLVKPQTDSDRRLFFNSQHTCPSIYTLYTDMIIISLAGPKMCATNAGRNGLPISYSFCHAETIKVQSQVATIELVVSSFLLLSGGGLISKMLMGMLPPSGQVSKVKKKWAVK